MTTPLSDPGFAFDHSIATVTWSDGVEMVFDRFHEDRRSHETSAEVTYFIGSNGTRRLLLRNRLNLGSTRVKTETATRLSRGAPEHDWHALLELASWKVIDALRRGRPATALRDVGEEPTTGGVVIPPLLLARDPVILFGDGGSAKSYLGLALAMSVESGQAFADLEVARRLRTAYLDFEWQPWPHNRRMRMLCGAGALPELLYVPCGAEGPLSGQVERLLTIFHEEAVEYVVLDSVALACAGAPEESAVALDFFQALTRLEVGSCLLAHINRSADEDRPFGSVFWHNSARATFFLKASQEPGSDSLDLSLTNRKANDGPRARAFALHFDFQVDRTTITRRDLASIPELAGTLPLKDRIRRLLASGPRTPAAIAEALESTRDVVGVTLRRGEGKVFVKLLDSKPEKWGLIAAGEPS